MYRIDFLVDEIGLNFDVTQHRQSVLNWKRAKNSGLNFMLI